jgi:hypothetical protein
MAYNLKKVADKQMKVSPLSMSIPDSVKKYNLSIDDTKNFNTYLDKDRRPIDGNPQTHEGMLEAVRKEAKASDKTLEGALADSKSSLYPHRQYNEKSDKFDVTPINMMSEAYDQKWRESFAKVNKSGGTEFWDKYINKDLDDNPTKVMVNVPVSGSQLQNKAERFKNLSSMPTDSDAAKNRENLGKKVEVDRLHAASSDKNVKIAVARLREADNALFAIHYAAANQNRDLTNEEKTIVASINKDKEKYLITLADNNMFDGSDMYRGDKEFQKELYNTDAVAADPQRPEPLEDIIEEDFEKPEFADEDMSVQHDDDFNDEFTDEQELDNFAQEQESIENDMDDLLNTDNVEPDADYNDFDAFDEDDEFMR